MTSTPLATVIAVALEQARTLDEDRIRQIVREELAALRPTHAGWLTPPAAAKALGVGVRRVRRLIDAGAVSTRQRNLNPSTAKQIKHEVELASLEAALRGEPEPKVPSDAKAWAAAKAARRTA